MTTVDENTFIGRLQAKTGLNFDLPTESQWEYACRAGTTSYYNNGGASDNDLKQLGRYSNNTSDGRGGYSEHTVVGSYSPNAWGLYDMHGNVSEWCLDWHGTINSDPMTDFLGAASGSRRVLRGGGWDYVISRYCGSSDRSGSYPGLRYSSYGFRLSSTLAPGTCQSPSRSAGAAHLAQTNMQRPGWPVAHATATPGGSGGACARLLRMKNQP